MVSHESSSSHFSIKHVGYWIHHTEKKRRKLGCPTKFTIKVSMNLLLYVLVISTVQICSGITNGRVLTGTLYTKISQVDLSAFIYRTVLKISLQSPEEIQ